MGHLINPISTRLGFTSFWISNWSCFNLSNFSYNLMIDNLIKNFIIWAFSENRFSVNLTVNGVFLSHFKIVRRNNNIRVFLFLILDSSRFFKSQSVEPDPNVLNFYNNALNKHSLITGSSSLSSNIARFDFLNKKKEFIYLGNKSNQFTKRSVLKNYLMGYISYFLSSLISKLFKLNEHLININIGVDTVFIKTTNFLNAKFLSRFLSRRLSYGFELSRILKPIVTNLKRSVDSRTSKIVGFRISCRGRFNKTQMASYTWEKYGPVPLNNFSCSIDYSFSKVIMRYGACGIKVWIFTSHPIFKNYRSSVVRNLLLPDVFKLSSSCSLGFIKNVCYQTKYFNIRRLRVMLYFLKLFSGYDFSKYFLKDFY